MQFDKSVDQKKFRDYLLRLRALHPFRRIVLLLDNLSSHRTKMIRKKFLELNYGVVFNVPYSPQLNAIEYVFSMVKAHYKRLKLDQLMNGGN